MAREQILASLDIGSTRMRMVMAQINEQEGAVQILGVVEVESQGVTKGVVTTIDDATTAISHCLEEAEKMIGRPIESVWVGISGGSILTQVSKGVVAIARTSGEIREDDLTRVLSAAEMIAAPPNYENVHSLVQSYSVDNQFGIKDPVGMTGIRLEAEAILIMALSSQIKNITKCIYRAGISIDDLVLGPLAASEGVLNQKQRDIGVALIDIGGPTTKLVVFEEGNFLHAAIIPVGGTHITNDIAIGLRTSIDVAEQIKVEYGQAESRTVPKKENIMLSEFEEGETESVSRRHVAEIIEARVEEILEKVDQELRKIKRSGRLPAGAVLVGGGAVLPGIVDAAKKHLRLPVSLGYPKEITTTIDKVNELSFATALGLIYWAVGARDSIKHSSFGIPPFVKKAYDKVPFLKRFLGFLQP